MLGTVKNWIGALTEVGLLLLALAIVAVLLVGANLPFFGDVVTNIMALVKSLGDAGLAGLIALAIIIWLFSGRNIALSRSDGSVETTENVGGQVELPPGGEQLTK
jgi:hypothetical protein